MAKTFKARFQQLIAPLSAWTEGAKKDFTILPGEIAFATAEVTDVKGGVAPVVLMKINNTDAEATWGSLGDSIYSKASDVYGWAKKVGIEVVDTETGDVVSDVEWKEDKLVIHRVSKISEAGTADKVAHTITVLGETFDGSADVEITADEVYEAIKGKVADDDADTTYTLSGEGNKIVLTPSEGSADEIAVEGTGIATVTVSGNKITVDVSTEATDEYAGLLSKNDKAKIDKLVVNADGTIGGTIEEAAKVSNAFTVFGKSFDGSEAKEVVYSDIEAQVKSTIHSELDDDIATAEQNAKDYTDEVIESANLSQYTTEAEVKSIVDSVIAEAADSDTYNSLTKLVDYIDAHGGEATEMAQAIDTLEGKVDTIEKKPAYGITAGDIQNWNAEIGAKALAAEKTTTEEVKTQIEAYGYATEADLTLAENRISVIEAKPAMGITAEQIVNWNKEIGALELANTKVDKSAYDAYVEGHTYKDETIDNMVKGAKDYADDAVKAYSDAHATDYTNDQINEKVKEVADDLAALNIEDLNQVEYIIFNANF